jgi:hypothetical protein
MQGSLQRALGFRKKKLYISYAGERLAACGLRRCSTEEGNILVSDRGSRPIHC